MKDTTPPAFPGTEIIRYEDGQLAELMTHNGLTQRQYIAIKAMASMVAGHYTMFHSLAGSGLKTPQQISEWQAREVALIPKMAYQFADAMIAEGNK